MRDALLRDYVTYLKVDYKINCWILTHHIFSPLYQKAANNGPWRDRILPPSGFVNKVLLEPSPFICLQVAASHYGSERPAKPICLLSGPLQKKRANPSLSRFRDGFPFLGPANDTKISLSHYWSFPMCFASAKVTCHSPKFGKYSFSRIFPQYLESKVWNFLC